MKDKKAEKLKLWILTSLVIGVLVLVTSQGCSHVTVKVTQTVETGGSTYGAAEVVHHPAGSGFVPGQAPVPPGSTGQLLTGGPSCCGPVTTNKIAFEFDIQGETSNFTQMAPLGTTSWQGYLTNLNTHLPIPNTDYCLYLAADGLHTGCCTPVSGSSFDVSRTTWAGYHIRFTAYFKSGHEPNGNDVIKVVGDPGWR